jgi:hypothetical protein
MIYIYIYIYCTATLRVTISSLTDSAMCIFFLYIAKVVAWFKQEGDIVKRNDVLCDIETKVGVACLFQQMKKCCLRT